MGSQTICMHRCQIVMVTGLRGFYKIEDVKEAAKSRCETLISHLMDVGPRSAKQFVADVIVNESWWFCKDGKTISEVENFFHSIPSCPECGGITRIILCHCHGSKIVYVALREENLTRRFEYTTADYKERSERLAIVSIGGLQFIPEDFARVSLNIRIDTDCTALRWRGWYNEEPNTKYNYKVVKNEGKSKDSRVRLSSSSSEGNDSHSSKTYLSNSNVIKAIKDGFS